MSRWGPGDSPSRDEDAPGRKRQLKHKRCRQKIAEALSLQSGAVFGGDGPQTRERSTKTGHFAFALKPDVFETGALLKKRF